MKRCSILLYCVLLTACGGTAARHTESAGGADVQQEQLPLGPTLVYECNGYDFIARRGAGEMALWLDDGYVVLPQAAGDSGTVYEDGDVSFWSDGDEAMLTVDGTTYQNCHQSPQRVPWEDARLRGVNFRGVGNEPGWYLEIQGSRILFVGQYGTVRIMVPEAVAESAGQARVYRGASGTQQMRVDVVDQPCTDSMSGEPFPNHVTVTVDSTAYQGCGQTLDTPREELE